MFLLLLDGKCESRLAAYQEMTKKTHGYREGGAYYTTLTCDAWDFNDGFLDSLGMYIENRCSNTSLTKIYFVGYHYCIFDCCNEELEI